jgi:hypothetical protein
LKLKLRERERERFSPARQKKEGWCGTFENRVIVVIAYAHSDTLTHSQILDNAWPIVRHPMGLPVTARCDTAGDQTQVCSDASALDRCATLEAQRLPILCPNSAILV